MKAKISVTVDEALLGDIDRLARGSSRSHVFEDALRAWVRKRGKAELDEAIDRYYRSRSPSEIREDDEWAALGEHSARQSWEE